MSGSSLVAITPHRHHIIIITHQLLCPLDLACLFVEQEAPLAVLRGCFDGNNQLAALLLEQLQRPMKRLGNMADYGWHLEWV
jgi:hypothetical protein